MADLRDLDPRPVRKSMTVVGERIIHELRGTACLSLDLVPARRKGCAVTRSFSARIEDRATLEEAVCAHATRLGEKLRLIPGHCDPTVDRYDWYVGIRGGRVECLWPIAARGALA